MGFILTMVALALIGAALFWWVLRENKPPPEVKQRHIPPRPIPPPAPANRYVQPTVSPGDVAAQQAAMMSAMSRQHIAQRTYAAPRSSFTSAPAPTSAPAYDNTDFLLALAALRGGEARIDDSCRAPEPAPMRSGGGGDFGGGGAESSWSPSPSPSYSSPSPSYDSSSSSSCDSSSSSSSDSGSSSSSSD